MRTILLLLCFFTLPSHAQSLQLGATDWCPYMCDNKAMPGFLTEYVVELLGQQGIEVQVVFGPWSRTVRNAETGALDGLINQSKNESHSLLTSKHPTNYHQNCFYTRHQDAWYFQDINSLKNKKLGVVVGYGYTDELDHYIQQQAKSDWVIQIIGSKTEQRLYKMLDNQRIDLYLSNDLVNAWELKQAGLNARPRTATCMTREPLYFSINPNIPNAQKIMEAFNQAQVSTDSQQRLQELMKKYR